MEINREIRSGDKKVDEYICALEDFLTTLENKNIYRLVKAVDENAGIIADDVILLGKESDDDVLESQLKMLGSRKNKRYETFLATIKQLKDFGIANSMLNELKPTEALKAVKTEEEIVIKKSKKNIQDFVIN